MKAKRMIEPRRPSDHRRIRTKADRGPHFPHCACCRSGTKHEALTTNNRLIRHKLKQRPFDLE